MTFEQLEQMTPAQRTDYFRSLPLSTLLRLAGDEADVLLEDITKVPHLNLEGVERVQAHKVAKAEAESLMGRLTGQA